MRVALTFGFFGMLRQSSSSAGATSGDDKASRDVVLGLVLGVHHISWCGLFAGGCGPGRCSPGGLFASPSPLPINFMCLITRIFWGDS